MIDTSRLDRLDRLEATQREMADLLFRHVEDLAAMTNREAKRDADHVALEVQREAEFQARRAEDIARARRSAALVLRASIASEIMGALVISAEAEQPEGGWHADGRAGAADEAVLFADALLARLAKL
jgi:hypothetical protein